MFDMSRFDRVLPMSADYHALKREYDASVTARYSAPDFGGVKVALEMNGIDPQICESKPVWKNAMCRIFKQGNRQISLTWQSGRYAIDVW